MNRGTINLLNVGRMNFKKSLALQQSLIGRLKHCEDERGYLIVVEHDPVYTIGIRTRNYSTADEEKLKKLGAEFYRTNRGGLITFHGLGQLVVYPILNLKHFKPSIKWYICNLEKSVLNLCRNFYNLDARISVDTGVWIGNNKICAIGVHGSRFITSHGLALNCNVDLNWFSHIVPCGLIGKSVTSLSKELNKNITVNEVLLKYLQCFSEIFQCSIEENVESSCNVL